MKTVDSLMNAVRPGQHLALLYRNRREQFETVVPYVRAGLERMERCLYVANDNSVGVVLKAFREGGIDVDAVLSSGALTVATQQETFLKQGVFNPQEMIALLQNEVRRALADGFTGFRGSGEMTWAVTVPSALARLQEYEDALDVQFPREFTGLCQYNEMRFEPGFISTILRNHPLIVARGRVIQNPFYIAGSGVPRVELPFVGVGELLSAAA